jgi:hypothetical protein
MNEKLQRIYYIIGIIQRIAMIIMTFGMMGVAYKIYNSMIQYGLLFALYGKEIQSIQQKIELIRIMLDKSWFF